MSGPDLKKKREILFSKFPPGQVPEAADDLNHLEALDAAPKFDKRAVGVALKVRHGREHRAVRDGEARAEGERRVKRRHGARTIAQKRKADDDSRHRPRCSENAGFRGVFRA